MALESRGAVMTRAPTIDFSQMRSLSLIALLIFDGTQSSVPIGIIAVRFLNSEKLISVHY